jgi:hypothetical protein
MYGFLEIEILGIEISLANEDPDLKKNMNLHVDRKWKTW